MGFETERIVHRNKDLRLLFGYYHHRRHQYHKRRRCHRYNNTAKGKILTSTTAMIMTIIDLVMAMITIMAPMAIMI